MSVDENGIPTDYAYPKPGTVYDLIEYPPEHPEGGGPEVTGHLPSPWEGLGVRLIHCDPLVLHKPGACQFCDEYGADLQKQRAERLIEFTGDDAGYAIADPARVNRPNGGSQVWPGNTPKPAGKGWGLA